MYFLKNFAELIKVYSSNEHQSDGTWNDNEMTLSNESSNTLYHT